MAQGEQDNRAIVRIFQGESDRAAGVGFWVAPGKLVTCAHVVNQALGLDDRAEALPKGAVSLDFPFVGGERLWARVVEWFPVDMGQVGRDLAVLELLDGLPEDVVAMRLGEATGGALITKGFPEGYDAFALGTEVTIATSGVTTNGWMQLENPGGRVSPGFSGAPVWEKGSGLAVGMIVVTDAGRDVAFMIPAGVMRSMLGLEDEAVSDVAAIDLEEPGGRMPIESRFYIDRPPTELNSRREILRAGALIRIKGPREFGKSSLMARMAAVATEAGAKTIEINFREIDAEFFGSLKDFLQYFCNAVTMGLEIEGELDERRVEKLGYKAACGSYFEKNILPQVTGSLVLELDEVDLLLGGQGDALRDGKAERAWVVDFFSMLRAWYDSKMKSHPQWKKLRLVLVHSKEIDRETLNQKQSPFNVGMELELKEFEEAQVLELARRYGVAQPIALGLMQFVGGHPQLVRKGLHEMALGQSSLDEILSHGATGSGLYKRHLEQLRSRIEQDTGLRMALQKVLASGEQGVLLDLQNKAVLRSFGVVVCQDDDVRIACELYRKYFSGLGL
jgi:AAA-like domain/Trypsin-like peptidase domain